MISLTSENYLLYAAKHYNNPSCSGVSEFHDDLKRFKYIKRLLKKYKKTGEIPDRLILNHLILLHNVFSDALIPLLFFKIEEEYWPQLKTFLVYLNYLPDNYSVTNTTIESAITLDRQIVNKLRTI
jgi:hypothetical protein